MQTTLIIAYLVGFLIFAILFGFLNLRFKWVTVKDLQDDSIFLMLLIAGMALWPLAALVCLGAIYIHYFLPKE